MQNSNFSVLKQEKISEKTGYPVGFIIDWITCFSLLRGDLVSRLLTYAILIIEVRMSRYMIRFVSSGCSASLLTQSNGSRSSSVQDLCQFR